MRLQNVNTCPIDRKEFNLILARDSVNGSVTRRVTVAPGEPDAGARAATDVAEEDVTYCEVCGECNREDRLLLCDGCDSGYHLECLDPPLSTVPIEAWFCPDCDAVNQRTNFAREVSAAWCDLLILSMDMMTLLTHE
jgi:PHD and RING finger domain-containing protein 1